jgi:hypothetical protein
MMEDHMIRMTVRFLLKTVEFVVESRDITLQLGWNEVLQKVWSCADFRNRVCPFTSIKAASHQAQPTTKIERILCANFLFQLIPLLLAFLNNAFRMFLIAELPKKVHLFQSEDGNDGDTIPSSEAEEEDDDKFDDEEFDKLVGKAGATTFKFSMTVQ